MCPGGPLMPRTRGSDAAGATALSWPDPLHARLGAPAVERRLRRPISCSALRRKHEVTCPTDTARRCIPSSKRHAHHPKRLLGAKRLTPRLAAFPPTPPLPLPCSPAACLLAFLNHPENEQAARAISPSLPLSLSRNRRECGGSLGSSSLVRQPVLRR